MIVPIVFAILTACSSTCGKCEDTSAACPETARTPWADGGADSELNAAVNSYLAMNGSWNADVTCADLRAQGTVVLDLSADTLELVMSLGAACPDGQSDVDGTAIVSMTSEGVLVVDQGVQVWIRSSGGAVIDMWVSGGDSTTLHVQSAPAEGPSAVLGDCVFSNWRRP